MIVTHDYAHNGINGINECFELLFPIFVIEPAKMPSQCDVSPLGCKRNTLFGFAWLISFACAVFSPLLLLFLCVWLFSFIEVGKSKPYANQIRRSISIVPKRIAIVRNHKINWQIESILSLLIPLITVFVLIRYDWSMCACQQPTMNDYNRFINSLLKVSFLKKSHEIWCCSSVWWLAFCESRQ